MVNDPERERLMQARFRTFNDWMRAEPGDESAKAAYEAAQAALRQYEVDHPQPERDA